jgi:hypothetical protein
MAQSRVSDNFGRIFFRVQARPTPGGIISRAECVRYERPIPKSDVSE